MTTPATDRERAARLYARLVALYPKGHREEFGLQMQRTFEDSYRHATEEERRAGIRFWLAVLSDEGRCIVREHAAKPQGDILFFALVVIWICAVLIVPVAPVVSDWHHLVLPTALLAVLLITIPGTSGLARRFATVVVAVAVFEWMYASAQSIGDENDLLAPALLVTCLTFSLKTLAGLNARIVGIRNSVWGREELAFGLVAGLVGVVALAFSAVDSSDSNPIGPFLLNLVMPFVCGLAGFRSSRRHRSGRSGVYAAFGAILIAVTMVVLSEPLVIQGALLTVFRDHPVPAAALVAYWQRPLSDILFMASLLGILGALFGQAAAESEAARRHPLS
ncbi:MAG TPA: hypothetical protein VG426_05570 [Candidatus Dormibacteraeota bacterium]|jgi:hypothetical protein|nr:hypothetical protein [Candidatus Dormibacteraeota bacterium]